MYRKLLLLPGYFVFLATAFATGPFAPAAGQPGTDAIHMDSSAFVSWATHIEVIRGYINIADTTQIYDGSNRASYGLPEYALGKATGNYSNVVSLGDGGMATLQFDRPIINGPGPDFAVFENGYGDHFLELAFVEVSTDGQRFVRFPAWSHTPVDAQVGGFGALNPTNIHNFAGKYRVGYGTPFDLEDLADSTGIDLNNIRFVRIIDVVGCVDCGFESRDADGNIVNDPWPTPFHTGGFDLEAVGVINAGESDTPTSAIIPAEKNIRIHPNPFSNKINVDAPEGCTVHLLDIMGRKLWQKQLINNVLDTSELTPGYYFLQIVHKDFTTTFKILKR